MRKVSRPSMRRKEPSNLMRRLNYLSGMTSFHRNRQKVINQKSKLDIHEIRNANVKIVQVQLKLTKKLMMGSDIKVVTNLRTWIRTIKIVKIRFKHLAQSKVFRWQLMRQLPSIIHSLFHHLLKPHQMVTKRSLI